MARILEEGEKMIAAKKTCIQYMRTEAYNIKYQKEVIERAVRTFRDKTKGDIWTEMTAWYDFINLIEEATREIRRRLIDYHALHDAVRLIDAESNGEVKLEMAPVLYKSLEEAAYEMCHQNGTVDDLKCDFWDADKGICTNEDGKCFVQKWLKVLKKARGEK